MPTAGRPTPAPRGNARLEDETLLVSPPATIVVDADEIVEKADQRAEAQLGVSTREIGRRFTDLRSRELVDREQREIDGEVAASERRRREDPGTPEP